MFGTERKKLDNGLTLLLTDYPQSRISAVESLVDFGPIDEEASKMGAAHFIEHMLFKGTEKRSALDISRYIDDVGGNMNAATMKDMTAYYVELPQKHLDRAVELLSDILQNSRFPEKEMEQEKKVIQEEIQMIKDMPQRAIWDNLFALAFKNTPAGMSISGTPETVDSLTREDLFDIYSRQYGPERMVISIVADMEKTSQEQIETMVSEKFSTEKKTQPIKREVIQNKKTGTEISDEKREINQAHQIIALKFPNVTQDPWLIGRAVQKYLTGGMSSVLFTEIREKRGLAYSVYSDYSASKTYGLYSIYTATSKENREKAEKIILDELKKLREEKIKQEDMARLKGYMEGEFLTKMDSKLTLAGTLAHYEMYDTYETAGKYLQSLESITSEKIQEFAGEYLDTENCFKVLIQPKGR